MTCFVFDLTSRGSAIRECAGRSVLQWTVDSTLNDQDTVLAHWTNLCSASEDDAILTALSRNQAKHFGRDPIVNGELAAAEKSIRRLRSELRKAIAASLEVRVVVYSGGSLIGRRRVKAYLESLGPLDGLPPSRLKVESAESSIDRDATPEEVLRWLRELGVVGAAAGPTPDQVAEYASAVRLLIDAACWIIVESERSEGRCLPVGSLSGKMEIVECLSKVSQHQCRAGLATGDSEGAFLNSVLAIVEEPRSWQVFSRELKELPGFQGWMRSRQDVWSKSGMR